MRDFANDFIRPQMERVKGVSLSLFKAALNGKFKYCSIPPNSPNVASALMLPLEIATRTPLRAISTVVKTLFLLRVIGRFEDLNQLKQLILKRQGNTNILLARRCRDKTRPR